MKKFLLLLFPICAFAQSGNVDGSLRTVTASGTNNYVISGELLPTSYDPRERFIVVFSNANTGACTLKRGSLSALPLQFAGGIDLVSGSIKTGERKLVSCTGTYYQIIDTGIILTTTGTSGAATLTGNALNIPNYSLSGSAGGDLSGTYPNPTVVKINGTSLAGLSTGLLKNTTGTGVPSIAVSGTDYQAPITLTTTGTSGGATFIGNTLNIPNYSGGGGGLSTASQGLTAVGSDVQLGGILTGGTLTTISSTADNGLKIQMFDATSHGGVFQVSSAFSIWNQNSNSDANTFAARIQPNLFTFEYPVNTVIGQWSGSTKSLTVGNAGTGFVSTPHLFVPNITTATGTQNDLIFWNVSAGEIMHTANVGFNATSHSFYTSSINMVYTPVDLGSVSSSQNNYAIGDGVIFKINATAGITITGISGGIEGRIITISDVGSFNIVFPNLDGSSSAANQFAIPGGFTLAAGNSCQFAYINSSWRLTSKTN